MSEEGTVLTTGDQVARGAPTAPSEMREGEPASPRIPCPTSHQDLRAAGCWCLGKKGSCILPLPCLLSRFPMPQPLRMTNTFRTHAAHLLALLTPLGWLTPALQSPEGTEAQVPWGTCASSSSGWGVRCQPFHQPFPTKDTFVNNICLTFCLPVPFFLFLVEFQSSSRNTSLHTHPGRSVTLDCRFALAPSNSLSSLEWRRQHQGSGRHLFQYRVGSTGPAVQPKVHVDMGALLGNGDASLRLEGVSVEDEGTYICLVSTPLHQAQHIIKLHVAGEEEKCPGGQQESHVSRHRNFTLHPYPVAPNTHCHRQLVFSPLWTGTFALC